MEVFAHKYGPDHYFERESFAFDILSVMYICLCNGVTDRQIRTCCQREGARSLDDLERCLGVGAGCGRCREAAADLLEEHTGASYPLPEAA